MDDSTSKGQQTCPKTVFVSGPIEPPEDYFHLHYKTPLLHAITAGHSFIMGPAPGMDTKSLHFLVNEGVDPSKITVYLAEFEQKLKADSIQWFVQLGGNIKVEGETTGQRDAAMTRDSDYDILRYMTIEEQKTFYGDLYYFRVSATEKNERRRKGLSLHSRDAQLALIGHPNKKQPKPDDPATKAVKKVLDVIFGRW